MGEIALGKIAGKYAGLIEEQLRLKTLLSEMPLKRPVRFVAGADVSVSLFSKTGFGGIVVLDITEGLKVVDKAVVRSEIAVPYIPGLLGFREVPLLEKAYRLLKITPDVMIVDAQGKAHPRGFGSACHLGVVLGAPTIGCAKTLLCGEYEEPALKKGSKSPLIFGGKIVGYALRTKDGTKPVFVSAGNLVALGDCAEVVLKTTVKYRLPEPSRLAHILVNEERKRA